jgi:hypothetical protein
MRLRKTKLFALTALVIGVLFCAGVTAAYADEPPPVNEGTLSVDEVWLTGDTLHIAVTDKSNDEKQTLELNLSDYAKPGDEYVSVQATDSAGRTSNVIQFKNPYYAPAAQIENGELSVENDWETDDGAGTAADGAASESALPGGMNPFTPDGQGEVVDNATENDGKEFFTVETPDGNTFYLIVDRQRNAENVYFLNAVTEDDLRSLAKSGDGKTPESAVPTPEAPVVTPAPEQPPEPEPEPPAEKPDGGTGAIAFVVIAALVAGGAGYYFKILRPKKNGADDFDAGFDEPDDDEEMPLSGDDDSGESEVDEE